MLAAGATRPVLAAVAETLLWRAGGPARPAFYEDSPYVSPERLSRLPRR